MVPDTIGHCRMVIQHELSRTCRILQISNPDLPSDQSESKNRMRKSPWCGNCCLDTADTPLRGPRPRAKPQFDQYPGLRTDCAFHRYEHSQSNSLHRSTVSRISLISTNSSSRAIIALHGKHEIRRCPVQRYETYIRPRAVRQLNSQGLGCPTAALRISRRTATQQREYVCSSARQFAERPKLEDCTSAAALARKRATVYSVPHIDKCSDPWAGRPSVHAGRCAARHVGTKAAAAKRDSSPINPRR